MCVRRRVGVAETAEAQRDCCAWRTTRLQLPVSAAALAICTGYL
jgi:hypothetical protein